MMMIMMRIKLDEHGIFKSHNDTMQVLFCFNGAFIQFLDIFFYFPSPCTRALAACSIVETDKTPFFSPLRSLLYSCCLSNGRTRTRSWDSSTGYHLCIIQKIVSTFSFIIFYKRLNHFFAFPLPSST